ncbi:MAG: hypothetical protein LUC06_06045, partial [Oscillospiraceae bacterium]|nr:hypothetical protein [Oscillospiraceae bacterium]
MSKLSKKIGAWLLTFAMLLSLTGITAFADTEATSETMPGVVLGSDTVTLAGSEDSVMLPLTIENNPGFSSMEIGVEVPDGWTASGVYLENAGEAALTEEVSSGIDENGNVVLNIGSAATQPDVEGGTITVGSVSYNLNGEDTSVLVPVSIANNPGFASLKLTVSVPEGWTTSNVYLYNGDETAITGGMTASFK